MWQLYKRMVRVFVNKGSSYLKMFSICVHCCNTTDNNQFAVFISHVFGSLLLRRICCYLYHFSPAHRTVILTVTRCRWDVSKFK